MHANKFASMMQNVLLSTSTYLIQDTITTVGSGLNLDMLQMAQPRLTALSRIQMLNLSQHLQIHSIKFGTVMITIWHIIISIMMNMTIDMVQVTTLIILMLKQKITHLNLCVIDTLKSTDVLVEQTSRDGRIKLKPNVSKFVTEQLDVKDSNSSKLVANEK